MSDISYQWPPDYSPVPPKSISCYHLLDEGGLKELNYLRGVHERLIEHLAGRYLKGDGMDVSILCDKHLDQGGRLLGEVRQVARKQL